MFTMNKHSEQDRKLRERIQGHFWDEVGAAEHVSIPELENFIKREFRFEDGRRIQNLIRLMQTEGRIRVESVAKVWIRPPNKQ